MLPIPRHTPSYMYVCMYVLIAVFWVGKGVAMAMGPTHVAFSSIPIRQFGRFPNLHVQLQVRQPTHLKTYTHTFTFAIPQFSYSSSLIFPVTPILCVPAFISPPSSTFFLSLSTLALHLVQSLLSSYCKRSEAILGSWTENLYSHARICLYVGICDRIWEKGSYVQKKQKKTMLLIPIERTKLCLYFGTQIITYFHSEEKLRNYASLNA